VRVVRNVGVVCSVGCVSGVLSSFVMGRIRWGVAGWNWSLWVRLARREKKIELLLQSFLVLGGVLCEMMVLVAKAD